MNIISKMKEKSIKCPICLEDNTSYVTFSCQHNTCTRCFLTGIIYLNTNCSLCRSNLPEVEPIIKKFHEDVVHLNKVQLDLFDMETENRVLKLDLRDMKKKKNVYKKLSKNLTSHVLDLASDSEEEYENTN